MRIRALSAVLPWLLLILVVASSCDLVDVTGIEEVLALEDGSIIYPYVFSSNGELEFCVFQADRDGEYPSDAYSIWGYDFVLGSLYQLTDGYFTVGGVDTMPVYDNGSVYFIRTTSYSYNLCKVPLDGNEDQVTVISGNIKLFDINSEGDKAAVFFYDYPYEALGEYDLITNEFSVIPNAENFSVRNLAYLNDNEIIAYVDIYDAPQFTENVVVFPVDGSEPYTFANIDYQISTRRIEVCENSPWVVISTKKDGIYFYQLTGGDPISPVPADSELDLYEYGFIDPEDTDYFYFCARSSLDTIEPHGFYLYRFNISGL